jgi:hypothetical protein
MVLARSSSGCTTISTELWRLRKKHNLEGDKTRPIKTPADSLAHLGRDINGFYYRLPSCRREKSD